jgi:hypothetical protein
VSSRARGLVAIVIAAIVFGVLVWFDADPLKHAQQEAAAFFRLQNFMWLNAVSLVVVVGAAIAYGGLAWWSRSFAAGLVFLLGGIAELLVAPIVFTFTGDWPLGLNIALSWWVTTTSGPLNAAGILAAGLVIAGPIGLYRWAVTRRLAVVDR